MGCHSNKKGFNERRANKERKDTAGERGRERDREMGEEGRGRGEPDHNNDPRVNYRLINHYVYKYIFL